MFDEIEKTILLNLLKIIKDTLVHMEDRLKKMDDKLEDIDINTRR